MLRPVTINEKDQQTLDALAEAQEQYPELADILSFHRHLFEVQLAAKSQVVADMEVKDDEGLVEQLIAGVPLLSFDQLDLESFDFGKVAEEIAQVLIQHYPDLAEQEEALAEADWLALARRNFEANSALSEGEESSSQLVDLAAGYALMPFLQRAAEVIMPHIKQEHWIERYCPVCGGQPEFAVLTEEAGARHLLCSRCGSLWLYKRLECPFCGNQDHTKLAYYPSEDEMYRLYTCQVCKRYLKAVDLRKARRKVHLPVEPLLTVAMDVAAQQEGYE